MSDHRYEKDKAASRKAHEDVLAVLQRLTTVTTVEQLLECVRIGAGIALEAQRRKIAERFGP